MNENENVRCSQCGRYFSNVEVHNRIADLERQLAEKQAKIDRLMLEFCPEEMTQEQKEAWASHQKPANGEARKPNQYLAAQELVNMLDELAKHASALLKTMSASEAPDAHYWIEGRWNAEPAYHIKQDLRDFDKRRKPK